MVGWRLMRWVEVPPKRNALIDGHVVADLGGLADDHAHAVIDEEAPADFRAG